MFDTTTLTAPALFALFDTARADGRTLRPRVLAPDFRDPSGMATVARRVEASTDTSLFNASGQWTLTFADDVPGNSFRLVTSATRRFTLACSYDSGAATDCAPLCSEPATHVVVSRNGTYGPFHEPMCARHVRPSEARAYPGHIETRPLSGR